MKTKNTTYFESTKALVEQKNTSNNNEVYNKQENIKNNIAEILNEKEEKFNDFTQRQQEETDLARLLGSKKGGLLKEQLKFLGINGTKTIKTKEEEYLENKSSMFEAPGKTVILAGLAM